ncbi:oligopeptide/dipeptide ABC transporter ATP-binding protein [Clostridium oceanicum]|uniref:Dipeptide ABC transporter ATP-binding protein n=1 Tax=Clostridium oceanicum TaxID=1543 RepID=A0ABN1JLS5_9CLOT
MCDSNVILEVKKLKKEFLISKGFFNKNKKYIKAVDDISFKLKKGETLGIVGESGCGKSTMARLILRLIEPSFGEVYFEGKNIFNMTKGEIREFRKKVQIVFQDPAASLNPKMTVKELLEEPLKINFKYNKSQVKEKLDEIIDEVGLDKQSLNKYPCEFSGGQKQRICIARALILRPKVLICDESVSALDVSIQSQIINLLNDLKEKYNMTYIFISHDLSVVKHISNRVGVLYLGKIVELGKVDDIFDRPKHPYTKSLIDAIPIPDPDINNEEIFLKGEVESSRDILKGCKFQCRCRECMEICKRKEPEFEKLDDGSFLACHLKEKDNFSIRKSIVS